MLCVYIFAKMDNSDSDTENLNPPDIKDAAEDRSRNFLLAKSKKKYESEYLTYKSWKERNSIEQTSENIILSYFNELSKTKKPSTLWAIFSMLKSTIDVNENLKIGNFKKVLAFLKKQNKGFQRKKAKTFTVAQIKEFLETAPDDTYLVLKVVTVFGVYGAVRNREFTDIKVKDIEYHDNLIQVNIPENRTGSPRSFAIEGEMCQIVLKYGALRLPMTKTDRFFVNYQHGKCTTQVIGAHKFEKMPKQIAEFLNLENSESYTGHAFRQTSATLLTDAGVDISMLRQHGNWQSATASEANIFSYEYLSEQLPLEMTLSYVEDSVENKRKIGCMIGKEDSISENNDIINKKIKKELSPSQGLEETVDMQNQPIININRRTLVTPPHVDLEKLDSLDSPQLIELVKLYMTENEALKKENYDLFSSREMLQRDHEVVCRENERLLKKVEEVNASPLIPARPAFSAEILNLPETETTVNHWTNADDATNDSNSIPESIQKELQKRQIGTSLPLRRHRSFDDKPTKNKITPSKTSELNENSNVENPKNEEASKSTRRFSVANGKKDNTMNKSDVFGSVISLVDEEDQ